MGDLEQWFKSMPLLTRYWFSGTLIFSLLGRFGLLNPHWLILVYEYFFYNFHVWRPITALFYYPITPATGFHFLINMYFLYSYSTRLETSTFATRPADYLFLLVFLWATSCIVALLANIMVLMDIMVMAVLYIWCRLNSDVEVTFWFGSRFQAMYLPWVLMVFNLVVAGGGFVEFAGILVGHLYYFLGFTVPQELNGPVLLVTPQFFKDWLPGPRGGASGFGMAPQRPSGGAGGSATGGALFRGSGHSLRD